MNNFGIFFKHPRTEKHGLKSLTITYPLKPNDNELKFLTDKNEMLDRWYINIEVINRDSNFDPEQIKDFLDKHWNSQKKLLKLQECGTVWKLTTNVKDCDTEVSHFRNEYKGKMKKYEDDNSGELTYYIEQKDCPDPTLKIPLYATLGKNLIKSDCKDNEWEYAFVFDEKTKKFEMLKIDLD